MANEGISMGALKNRMRLTANETLERVCLWRIILISGDVVWRPGGGLNTVLFEQSFINSSYCLLRRARNSFPTGAGNYFLEIVAFQQEAVASAGKSCSREGLASMQVEEREAATQIGRAVGPTSSSVHGTVSAIDANAFRPLRWLRDHMNSESADEKDGRADREQRIAADDGQAARLLIPRDGEQRFHGIVNTDSTATWTGFHGMVNSLRRCVARCSRSWKGVHDRGKWGVWLEIDRKQTA
jgi:hypothetical protein